MGSGSLRDVDWVDLVRRLTALARRRLGRSSTQDACGDLAQEAIRRSIETWDPAKHASLFLYAGSIVNRLVSNERASARKRLERPARDEDEINEAEDARDHERGALRRDLAKKALTLLRLRVAGDAICARLLDLIVDEITKPEEQLEAFGKEINIDDIYKARRRLQGHAAQIARELDREEP